MKNNAFLGMLTLAAGLLAVLPASAQFYYPDPLNPLGAQSYATVTYTIPGTVRSTLRSFIDQERDRVCTANRDRGLLLPCITPETPVNVYLPGAFLPPQEPTMTLPDDVLARLESTPVGTQYVYAAYSVYLIDVNTRRVIDFVSLPER